MAKTAPKDTIISVIGTQYFQPVADLLSAFLKRNPPKSDAISSGYFEGSYVVSILLLLVAIVESIAARDRFFNTKSQSPKFISVPEYMKDLHGYRGYLRLSELYIVRDVIFHNHVWVLDFLTSEAGNRKLLSANRVLWSGNSRFTQRVNPRTLKTKLLKLNIVPTRMDRKDLLIAFDVTISVLQSLEQRGANPVAILQRTVSFQGEKIPFSELRERLANTF